MELRAHFDDIIVKEFYHGRYKNPGDRKEKEIEGMNARYRKFEKLLDSDADFYILHQSVNITAAWFSMLSAAIIEDLGDKDDGLETYDEQIVGLAFFSRLASDLWAIIELVEFGFDLQARALTRSYLEHIDVLICCIDDRSLTGEFIQAFEPEDANAFWHRHVSKNRAKAKVASIIGSKIGRSDYPIVDLLREDADLAGSILLHPTMMAGFMAAFGNEDGDYESYPIFPTPLPASVGVFRTILIHHLWLSFVMGPLPKVTSGDWRQLVRTERLLDNKELDKLARLHWRMLQFLLDNKLLMKPDDEP